MRATLLDWLPADLAGRRLLDAGCGTGALAVEAARRGAEVVAIDLSPTLVALAQERLPADLVAGHGAGSIDFRVGDMLRDDFGAFDHVVAMDSLIHYEAPDMVRMLDGLADRLDPRTRDASVVFTFAPRTPALTAMHAVGRLFPRGDRAPAIEPVAEAALRRRIERHDGPGRLAPEPDGAGGQRLLHLAGDGAGRPMIRPNRLLVPAFARLSPRLLPFADAASAELPLGRLLRLALFQVSAGMALVLLNGTLNRVMIVELGVPTVLVSVMVALPLVFAPLRALIGFKSDTHRSVLGWRRVPYIWMGTLLQFGGLAIMPFRAAGAVRRPATVRCGPDRWGRRSPSCWSGAGMHTSQTAGLALATDLGARGEPAAGRGAALRHAAGRDGRQRAGVRMAPARLHPCQADPGDPGRRRADHGAQPARAVEAGGAGPGAHPARTCPGRASARPGRPSPPTAGPAGCWWRSASAPPGSACRTSCSSPMGGEILGLSVGATTALTALLAGGTLGGFALAARALGRGHDPHRLAAYGALVGIVAFSVVIFAAPLNSPCCSAPARC